MSDRDLQTSLSDTSAWMRLLFMILFMMVLNVVGAVLGVLITVQFFLDLITEDSNENCRKFGSDLAEYVYQIIQFLSYNTDEKPFPFSEWPDTDD